MTPAERPLESLTRCCAHRDLVGLGMTDVQVERNTAVAERMGLDGRHECRDLGGSSRLAAVSAGVVLFVLMYRV